jgi:hypothetical protein
MKISNLKKFSLWFRIEKLIWKNLFPKTKNLEFNSQKQSTKELDESNFHSKKVDSSFNLYSLFLA